MNDQAIGLDGEYLFELKHFCAVTFPNTSSALRAEKLLNELGTIPFLIIPSPLNIVNGCGLSIKTATGFREEMTTLLNKAGIQFEGVFTIDKISGFCSKHF